MDPLLATSNLETSAWAYKVSFLVLLGMSTTFILRLWCSWASPICEQLCKEEGPQALPREVWWCHQWKTQNMCTFGCLVDSVKIPGVWYRLHRPEVNWRAHLQGTWSFLFARRNCFPQTTQSTCFKKHCRILCHAWHRELASQCFLATEARVVSTWDSQEVSRFNANNVPLMALEWPTMQCCCLCAKLSLLHRVSSRNVDTLSSELYKSLDVESISLVKSFPGAPVRH